jgi:hypothetical protein
MGTMCVENLTLLLAVGTVLLTVLGVVVAFRTLSYMRGRDLEVDTRNGWVEIHKAMVNLRVRRSMALVNQAWEASEHAELVRTISLATAQLRGQLDRLNDDPLIVELAAFLDANKLTGQWQTAEYEKVFDAFCHKVAMKSRPK